MEENGVEEKQGVVGWRACGEMRGTINILKSDGVVDPRCVTNA